MGNRPTESLIKTEILKEGQEKDTKRFLQVTQSQPYQPQISVQDSAQNYEYTGNGNARRLARSKKRELGDSFIPIMGALNAARKDPLTSTYKPEALKEFAERRISRDKGKERNSSVLYIDVDNFKHINDTYGHQEGNKILHELGNVIQDTIRGTDIFKRTQVPARVTGRYGGDEFVVFLYGANYEQAQRVKDRLEKSMGKNDLLKKYSLTASMGISTMPGSNIEEALNMADDAMYRAKHTRKTLAPVRQ